MGKLLDLLCSSPYEPRIYWAPCFVGKKLKLNSYETISQQKEYKGPNIWPNKCTSAQAFSVVLSVNTLGMPRYRDEPPAIRVYTVCDESKFLIVKNVPALGCHDDLAKLFATYGEVEECKPMDAEDCEPFTDVYWIKFQRIDNARFAKRKLDEFVFVGNRLQVSFAPQYESLTDTKEKLEGRRRDVLTRLNPQRSKSSATHMTDAVDKSIITSTSSRITSKQLEINQSQFMKPQETANNRDSSVTVVSSNKPQEYFPSESMNQIVRFVREKLNKIQSGGEHLEAGASKKARVDNRRRI